ncbi:MAG: alpha/beta fold hydrolase [Paracoccaceae bacterium]
MSEQTTITSIDSSRQSPALRLLAGSVGERDVFVAKSAASAADRLLGRAYRSARERFQAVTNIGLSYPKPEAALPRRHRVVGRDGLPALSYLASGDPEGQRVIFIHGTPGEASDWMPFLLNVPAGQRRLAVDRPGFGESGPGRPVVALSEQARAIAALLKTSHEPAILVGSSYGGPVALRIAADYPEAVSGVLLVGAAADPVREKTHPVQRLVSARAIDGLLPRPLSHSNAELLALRRELEVLGDGIGQIRAPVTVLQGVDDTLVPAENATYIAGRLTGAERRRVIFVEQAGHFLHILSTSLVEHVLGHVVADADRGGRAAATAFG